MPKNALKSDSSRTAIILSGLGAILLMVSLYLIFRTNLPRLMAIIPMVILGCALTGFYRFNHFLLKTQADEPDGVKQTIRMAQWLAIGGLAFGWLTRLLGFSDWRSVWAMDIAGLLVMVSGMVLMIRVRLDRFQRTCG